MMSATAGLGVIIGSSFEMSPPQHSMRRKSSVAVPPGLLKRTRGRSRVLQTVVAFVGWTRGEAWPSWLATYHLRHTPWSGVVDGHVVASSARTVCMTAGSSPVEGSRSPDVRVGVAAGIDRSVDLGRAVLRPVGADPGLAVDAGLECGANGAGLLLDGRRYLPAGVRTGRGDRGRVGRAVPPRAGWPTSPGRHRGSRHPALTIAAGMGSGLVVPAPCGAR